MSIKKLPIVVLGAGAWGTALALLLFRNGNNVKLWSNDPAQIQQMRRDRCNPVYLPNIEIPGDLVLEYDLPATLQEVRDILIVVPSQAFVDVVSEIKKTVANPIRIAWGTKGLEPKTGKLLHEVVLERLGSETPMAVLSGPSFAHEVAIGLPTAVSLSGTQPAFTQDLIQRLHGDHFRVYENNDLIGVQLCGVLKNILAIGVGICDGLKLGANARSALITRGLAEMSRFSIALGALPSTLMSLAGIGDLVLTCTDNQSRNRRLGMAIGAGVSCQEAQKQVGGAIEGLSNTRLVWQIAQQLKINMPITREVNQILFEGFSPRDAVNQLLDRELQME
jgi:glycerol-3-phosphate dehydrogenase (NAD(P)+)